MEAMNDYLPTALVFLGLALLAIEVGVLGFSIVVLFFIGIGCLLTGLLMMINLLPQTLVAALAGSAVFSLLSAIALWKPLKKLQNNTESKSVTSDIIGTEFVLDGDVSSGNSAEVNYSGITWKVQSDEDIPKGARVEVIRTAVGVLTVKRAGE